MEDHSIEKKHVAGLTPEDELNRQEELQHKMLDNFKWDEGSEGTEDLPGFEVAQDIMNCVYGLVAITEKELSLQYFQGNSFNIPISIFAHDLLTMCFESSFSDESRAVLLECLYASYAGMANTPGFKETINKKVNILLPCEDTKYCFQVDNIILTDNPECPMSDFVRDKRGPATIQGQDLVDYQSVVAEIMLSTVPIPEN